MKKNTHLDLTLAVSLAARGFAYVLLEAPEAPFDWGISEVGSHRKNERIGARIHALLKRYHPQTLVMEDVRTSNRKRPDRAKKLVLHLQHLAHSEGVDVLFYSRRDVQAAFGPLGAQTKGEIARAIAIAVPAFGYRLPPKRKTWMNEDKRQMLFDAAALGIVHLSQPGVM